MKSLATETNRRFPHYVSLCLYQGFLCHSTSDYTLFCNFCKGHECHYKIYTLADSAVTPSKISADGFLWEKLASITASGTVTSISSGAINARTYLKIIAFVIPTGGTLNVGIRFNNDSGSNYSERGSSNGAADATGVSLSGVNTKTAVDANPQLTTGDFINVSSAEKLGIMETVIRGTAGAASAPERKVGTYKWSNTLSQITRVDLVDTGGTGDIAAGSKLLVLGHD